MAQTKKKPSKKKSKSGPKRPSVLVRMVQDDRFPKVVGLGLILLSLLLLFAFVSHLFTWRADQSVFSTLGSPWKQLFDPSIETENWLGRLGATVSHQFFYNWFGLASFLFIGAFATTGINFFVTKRVFPLSKIYRHLFFILLWLPPALDFILYQQSFPFGGGYGRTMDNWLIGFMGNVGTGLLLFFLLLMYLVVTFNFEITQLWKGKNASTDEVDEEAAELSQDPFEREDEEYGKEEALDLHRNDQPLAESDLDEEDPSTGLDMEVTAPTPEPEPEEPEPEKSDMELDIEETKEEKTLEGAHITSENYDPTKDLSNYKYPTIDLLEDYGSTQISIDKSELEKNKDQIIATLENYNITISKIKATVGPTVTLYEIVPAPGIRISKIKNLEDDIALSLAALGIRIIAPIPGKGTIGIEVPNRKKEIVSMRTMLASEKFITTKMELPIALGKNIANENYIADLAKMPHLLVAGATGQGKSVGINAILMSLLYKKHPSQLKLVLIDPKKVELSLYRTIEKHFLAVLPGEEECIITDTKKVVHTLNALTKEMDTRYDQLKDGQVRNIKEYNEKFVKRKLNPKDGHQFMPYIVLVVDEFADLMMTAGKEIEQPIARLAQLARAVGIHLIVATQRPSVNIITGTIKANFPARIGFKVTSKVDSRTILDAGGADQLIGRGDMLLSVGGHMVRLQCAFVDTHEVERVVDFIGEQQGYPSPFYLPEVEDEEGNVIGGLDPDERDEMFEEAARLVVRHQQGSTSMIQRKLKLGYNRAGRIMDQLEAAGIVGPNEGSKARNVLFPDEYQLEQFLNQSE